ncbi:hypothetical protein DdX_13576 [Ditylenchus destructor]|uniref:Uncharacterized protein n=1 Tax=Ditylenchus destructor TaxID=166010 RepID=A0AAD4MTM7_9BILA|nr:hypothetical protein DdX_13576 [Ditylenchus destructor]
MHRETFHRFTLRISMKLRAVCHITRILIVVMICVTGDADRTIGKRSQQALTCGYRTDKNDNCELGVDDDCVYNLNMTATRFSKIPCKESLFSVFSRIHLYAIAGRLIVSSPSVIASCDERNNWLIVLAGRSNPFASENVHDGETREFDDGGGDDSPDDDDDFTPDKSDFDSPSAADDAMDSTGKHKKKHHKKHHHKAHHKKHHEKHHKKHHLASRGKYFKKIHPKDEDDKLYARAYKGCYDFYPDCKHKLTKHDCTKPRADIGLFAVDEAIEGCAVYCRKCKEHNEKFDEHHKVRKGPQYIKENSEHEEEDEEDSEEHEGNDEDDSEDGGDSEDEEHQHHDGEDTEEDSELEEDEDEETGEEDDEQDD